MSETTHGFGSAEPPELEAEVEEWISKLYHGAAGQESVTSRYWWLRSVFQDAEREGADVDELVNEALFRYLGPVKAKLWAAAAGQIIADEDTLMPAIRSIAKQLGRPVREVTRECLYEHKHEGLINRFYKYDALTKDELELDWWRDQALSQQNFVIATGTKPAPGPPIDPERLAYQYPKAALEQIARRVLSDYFRKAKIEAKHRGETDPLSAVDQSSEGNPEGALRAKQIRNRYFQAVHELPPIQRAAWVLCRDCVLTDAEAAELLTPPLTPSQAGQVVERRPLSGEEAAEFFARDVSPDAAKAARKLAEVLKAAN